MTLSKRLPNASESSIAPTCASSMRSWAARRAWVSASCRVAADDARPPSCACAGPDSSRCVSFGMLMLTTIFFAMLLNPGLAMSPRIIWLSDTGGGGGALWNVPSVNVSAPGLARMRDASRSPAVNSSPSSETTVSPTFSSPSDAARPFRAMMTLSLLQTTPKPPSRPRWMTVNLDAMVSEEGVDACTIESNPASSIWCPRPS